jgi:hypothetical protein
MQTLEACMLDLVSRRVVSVEDALERMPNCAALKALPATPATRSA